MDSTQVYSFQSPDSYMTFYTMDSIYPQIHGNSIINNNNNNNNTNNLNDDNNSNSNSNNNNVFNVPSLGADDFRRVAIPERNKIQSTVKPKSSLTLLLESRPDHPNICDHPNDNEDNYCLEYSTLNINSQIVSSSLPLDINKNSQASNNNNNNNNNNNDNHNDINNSNSKNNDSDIGGLTGTISFTDLIHLVTEEENNLSKSQCDIFPTEEDGSVIDYLPDISKNQSILDFGLQDFVVVDKVSSKPLMHVHIGIKSTPSPNLEVPIKNAIPIPNNLTPLVMNDRISSSGSNSVATNQSYSYYTDQRERAASESALGPITIYYKKVGQDNWNIASKKLNDQLSASTSSSSSTPTSVSSYHVRGLKQKYLHSGIAKSMPEERLDSSLYSPVRQLSNDNDNNININNPTPKSSNVSNIQMPKMQMMKNSPFAFCHNISSSDSSDDSDDDENKDKTWGYSH